MDLDSTPYGDVEQGAWCPRHLTHHGLIARSAVYDVDTLTVRTVVTVAVCPETSGIYAAQTGPAPPLKGTLAR